MAWIEPFATATRNGIHKEVTIAVSPIETILCNAPTGAVQMFKEVHVDNIEERAGVPQIRALLARYRSLPLEHRLPAYRNFNPECLSEHASNLAIVEPVGEGDYLYVHYGRAIFETSGVEMLGSRVSQWTSEVGRFFCAAYDRACTELRPVYTVHRAHHAIRVHLWERLVMPTRTDDGSLRLVVFNKPREYLDDLLKTVLDASPDGVLALRCMRNAEGRIEDAMVITANELAAGMLGHSAADLLDKPILQLVPKLRGTTTWRRYVEVVETRQPLRFEVSRGHQGEKKFFDVKAIPLGDGFMVSIADVTKLKVACRELGAKNAKLSEEIRRREALECELRHLADVDALTGVASRRAFMVAADRAMARASKRSPLAIIAIDIDHFKGINDRYGHNAGDKVLTAIGGQLTRECRASDTVGRLGGEEFAILLPHTTLGTAAAIAERFREQLACMVIPLTEATDIEVRASFGVEAFRLGDTCESLLARTDACLYSAKRTGRDRVVVRGPGTQICLSESA